MSRRTTTRYLLGTIAGLAIVGVSTAWALALTEVGDATAGTAEVAATPDAATAATPGAADDAASGATVVTTDGTTPTEAAATSGQPTGEYTDGTYTGTGSYSTPDGEESITVTVTLSGDVVTAVKATGSASGGTSGQFQSQFLSSYSSEVVGKAIDEVSLSRVAGSSLTSGGFNVAMEEIRSDAQA